MKEMGSFLAIMSNDLSSVHSRLKRQGSHRLEVSFENVNGDRSSHGQFAPSPNVH